jgi:hypothetical protein
MLDVKTYPYQYIRQGRRFYLKTFADHGYSAIAINDRGQLMAESQPHYDHVVGALQDVIDQLRTQGGQTV